jgi:hypothetical protein
LQNNGDSYQQEQMKVAPKAKVRAVGYDKHTAYCGDVGGPTDEVSLDPAIITRAVYLMSPLCSFVFWNRLDVR